MAHWRRQYHSQGWENVPDHVAAKVPQVPNKYLDLQAPKRGPQNRNYGLPENLQTVLEGQVNRLAEGEHGIMARSDHVTRHDLVETVQWLQETVNKEIDSEKAAVQDRNRERLSSFAQASGEMSWEELADQMEIEPGYIKSKDFRHVAMKFSKGRGYTKQATNASGTYLPYDDAQMQESPGTTVFFVSGI